MTAPDDIDATAGEFVLGTLTASERAAVTDRRAREPQLDQAIVRWEELLAPLAAAIAPITPTEGLLPAIKRRLSAAPSVGAATPVRTAAIAPVPTGTEPIGAAAAGSIGPASAAAPPPRVVEVVDDRLVRQWRRRARFWETTTVLVGAIAAMLLLGIGLSSNSQRVVPGGSNFVAVLQKDANSPAFLVDVDMGRKSLTVRAISPEQHPDKSFQLWLVDGKNSPPKSLGVIGNGPAGMKSTLAKFDRSVVENATYAVSLEPLGGSPNSGPSGPVLWSGRLIQATP